MVMTGTVSADLQDVVSVGVLGMDGHFAEFEAVIDTGFNGDFMLPRCVIVELRLSLIWRR